tara:strand:- start:1365 stop:1733 length:369 start_codon:yes stop_codon:yes gene_type:complete
MPIITLFFDGTVQASVQINDIAYYVPVAMSGGFVTQNNPIVKIGPILSVGINHIRCDIDASTVPPAPYLATNNTNDMIMFSKDNAANMSSLLGYYAKIQLTNNSTLEAELYSLESDFFESSK